MSKNKKPPPDPNTVEGSREINTRRLRNILKNISKEHEQWHQGYIFKTHQMRVFDTEFKISGLRSHNPSDHTRFVSVWCIKYDGRPFLEEGITPETLYEHIEGIANDRVADGVTSC